MHKTRGLAVYNVHLAHLETQDCQTAAVQTVHCCAERVGDVSAAAGGRREARSLAE